MKVVIASIVLPYPLTSGGAQGIFSMIEELRHDHDITLLFPQNAGNTLHAMRQLQCLWPEVDLRPYSYARQLCHWRFGLDKARRALHLHLRPNDKHAQIHRILDHYGYYMSRDFRRFILQIINEKQPDLFQAEFYPYLQIADFLHAGLKRVFIHHELRFVRNHDCGLNSHRVAVEDLNKYDAVVALTDIDRALLAHQGVKAPIYTSPLPISSQTLTPTLWNGRLLFVGGYDHLPNQEGMAWFLSQVAPRINSGARQRLTLDLVGRNWDDAWLSNHNSGGIEIRKHGYVEHLESMAQGSIMVVPILSGSGMRMKILEGAALGTPIVTTSVGIEGINFPSPQACLCADAPDAFAQALQRLMLSPELQLNVSTEAQRLFMAQYSRHALAAKRQQVWQHVLSSTPSVH